MALYSVKHKYKYTLLYLTFVDCNGNMVTLKFVFLSFSLTVMANVKFGMEINRKHTDKCGMKYCL